MKLPSDAKKWIKEAAQGGVTEIVGLGGRLDAEYASRKLLAALRMIYR